MDCCVPIPGEGGTAENHSTQSSWHPHLAWHGQGNMGHQFWLGIKNTI